MTDIEIAESYKMKPIKKIAAEAGIPEDLIEPYGNYKCKVNVDGNAEKPSGKLILVSAMNPTPLGEGKTTVTIGLADGLRKLGKKAIAALREPSLGPVFGIKGGACGGGRSQVVPMVDINLHFNGDLHAVTSANNLLAAMLDNHIFQGNALNIDTSRILWRRCIDMNDRSLRSIETASGKKGDESVIHTGFDITAASEVMAILCLSENIADLKSRLKKITVAYDKEGKPVTAGDIKAENAMAILLNEALKPNLVQTLEGTPVFIHGGPFANIAHGCNSAIATRTALNFGEYCVTEAGFGADLGAEKFIDVKCRIAGLKPSCVVLVATVKSLKYNGGVSKENIREVNLEAVKSGYENLKKHIENITGVFGLPCVVAINRFDTDTDEEISLVKNLCAASGVNAIEMLAFVKGGEGAKALAEEVLRLVSGIHKTVNYAYELSDPIHVKLEKIVTKVYGGDGITMSDEVIAEIGRLERSGLNKLPVIIAKTQYSLSDNPKLLGRPQGFKVEIRDIIPRTGAGFIVAVAGDIMLMPGLSKTPAAEGMEIDADGNIKGLS